MKTKNKRRYENSQKYKDKINAMETLHAAIKILSQLGEMDAAYQLRVLHDHHFLGNRGKNYSNDLTLTHEVE